MEDPSCRDAQFTLTNKSGLHARAAAAFVRALTDLHVDVTVRWNGRTANGRSILDLLTLGAPPGSTIAVSVRGTDADAAITALARLIENRFNED